MEMEPFYCRFPNIAEKETRAFILPQNSRGLKKGRYTLVESYCNDYACDCRRVFVNVLDNDDKPIATIGYGWENLEFYEKWMQNNKELAKHAKGPILEITGYATKYSEPALSFFNDTLLNDATFIERLRRHYQMFKDDLKKTKHKLQLKSNDEFSEKDLLQKAIKLESEKQYDSAVDILSKILANTPDSYHALFLKARNARNKGNNDVIGLKKALQEAIKQDASLEIFELFENELREYCADKNTVIMTELLNLFIEKKNRDIEKAFGFNWYVELKNSLLTPRKQSDRKVLAAFFELIDSGLKVIKTDNGTIKEIFDMSCDEIKQNLNLLEKDDGKFYDEILEISYAFLGKNFFAYVSPCMIMFSAKKEDANKMMKILDKYGIEYCAPNEIKDGW